MRTLLCTLCCLLLFSLATNAQSNNSADCRTAIPICADGEVILPFVDGSGDIDDFGSRDDFSDADAYASGCLVKGSNSSANLEHNTAWFVFRAGTGGQVGFNIQSLCEDGTENCTPTAEWDFAVYGPDVSCADIANRTALPIRCNIEVNDTNYTGLGTNPQSGLPGVPPVMDVTEGNMNTYDEWLDVLPGEIYYIVINNYNTNQNDDPEPFELTFTGSSVEADQDLAIDCTLRDEFLGLDISACIGDMTANSFKEHYNDAMTLPFDWDIAQSPSSTPVPTSEVGKAKVATSLAKYYIENDDDIKEILPLISFILEDDFLQKEVVGIQKFDDDEYQFSARSGNYKIDFGKLSEMDVKFKKLKAFYNKTFEDKTIQNYKSINLKYHNQVVCTK